MKDYSSVQFRDICYFLVLQRRRILDESWQMFVSIQLYDLCFLMTRIVIRLCIQSVVVFSTSSVNLQIACISQVVL